MKSSGRVSRLSYAVRVALLYALLGAAWIVLSDYALLWIAPNSRAFEILQTYKGLIFIFATTVALFVVLRTQAAAIEGQRRQALLQAVRQSGIAGLGLQALEAESPQQVAEQVLKKLQDQLGVRQIALGAWTREGEPLAQVFIDRKGRIVRENLALDRLAPVARSRSRDSLGLISEVPLETVGEKGATRGRADTALVAALGGSGAWFGAMAFLDPTAVSLASEDEAFVKSALAVVSSAVERHLAAATSRFQAELLDAVGEAIIATDPAGKIIYWNRAAGELFGWAAEEVLGRDVIGVTLPEDAQEPAAEIMERLNAGQSWRGRFELRRKDGQRFPALVTDTPILNRSGELVGVIGVSADISELQRAQQELAGSERLHRLILDNISDAVFMTDQSGHFTFVCPNVDVIFGYSIEEVEGMGTIDKLIPIEATVLERAAMEGEVRNLPVEVLDAEGAKHELLVNVKQVALDGSQILITGRDVTERVAAQQSLALFARQLGLQHELDQLSLSGADPSMIARVGLAGLQDLAPSDGSSLLENDPDDGMARPLASHGSFLRFPDDTERIPFDELWANPSGAGSNGSQVRISDLWDQQDLPQQLAISRDLGVRSVLVNQLVAGERMVGSLGLFRLQVDPFTDEEARSAQAVADTLALGLLNRQLVREEERRLYELEAVRQASLRVTSELDLHTVLDSIALSVINLVSCSDVHIFVHHDGDLEFGVARWKESDRREPYAEPRPDGITARAAHGSERIVIDDVSESPLFGTDHPWKRGAIVSIPLKSKGRVVGVMNVAYDEPHPFSGSELRILDLLADQASIAIANARLFEAESRQRGELEALLQVGKQLTGQHDLQGVFDSIVHALLEVVSGAEAASLWLYDRDRDRIAPVAYQGYEGSELGRLEISPSVSLVGEVVRAERTMLFHHAPEHPSFVQFDDERLDKVQSVLGAPIRGQERVIGALFVDSFSDPEAFTDEDRRVLEGLADQAAAAIEGARLFDQVNASRLHLQELSRELVRAQEEERRRIARELHDEIGQLLTGAKLTLEMAKHEDQEQGGRIRSIDEALGLIQELLGRARELSLNLRPSMLDDLGLLPALEWHLARYQSATGVTVDFEHRGIEDARFPGDVEITAYRVVQESLTNVARHAQADRAAVRIWLDDESLSLEIEDHGVGFDYGQALDLASTGGLSGMRERIELLGGRFFVESELGSGTLVRAELPLDDFLERRTSRRTGE